MSTDALPANDPVRFDGRVALVTGAARGIGAAIAARLAELGATVAAADILPQDQWEDALPAGGPHTRHHVDITSAASCKATVDEVLGAHGRLDHLVNNAGIVRRRPAATTTEEDFHRVIDVNLTGTFRMSQAAYPALKEGEHASVVNIGSTNGHIAVLDTLAYCVSKAGVMHMARVLALEWAPDNIRVNAVGPTIVPTAMTEDVRANSAYMDDKMASIPLGRMAGPRDVALTVTHLLSPAAAMTTGQTIFVDGGVVIH